ncbi:MAG: ATP-binding cassette domain-containing protein [Oscillospiraceae bacterium]|nr:ATP-binding cassette domain-containing protein [Oscillospiraceae bacterium]
MIQLNHVNIKFKEPVIEDGEIQIPAGKLTAITGPSGSGKTTLLYCLGLISSNKDYEYLFDGEKIDVTNDEAKGEIRKTRIGYIFQDNNLIDGLTVRENLRLAATLSGEASDNETLASLIELVGMPEKLGDYPKQLSGGEQQRLAVACALAKNPDLIIADEPTSALDAANTERVMELFRRIAYERGKMVAIATHDPVIYGQADLVYSIEEKKIILTKEDDGKEPSAEESASKKEDGAD